MPYYQTWEEFARAAEKLYLTDPMKVGTLYFTNKLACQSDRQLAKQLASDVTAAAAGLIFVFSYSQAVLFAGQSGPEVQTLRRQPLH